jgi:hypothetical protein
MLVIRLGSLLILICIFVKYDVSSAPRASWDQEGWVGTVQITKFIYFIHSYSSNLFALFGDEDDDNDDDK